jgi:hypothetical protein
MDTAPIQLAFDGGTLVVTGATGERLAELPHVQFDQRAGVYRAEGLHYRALVEHLRRERIAYEDRARAWQPVEWRLRTSRDPFPHQKEALEAWWSAGGRGVVVLPTGTGKTHLAVMAIHKTGRPTLVVTPTPARRTSPSWPSTRLAGPPWSSRPPSTCSTSGTVSCSSPSTCRSAWSAAAPTTSSR